MGHATSMIADGAARPRGISDLATTALAGIAIALPLMFYLRQHVEILRHGYEIEALKERRAELAERSRELAIRRAEAASLPAIEERAAAMGLVAPEPEDVLVATGDEADCPPAVAPRGATLQARLE